MWDIEREITITHRYGIHARPSASIKKTVDKFKCCFCVSYKGKEAEANDILALLELGVGYGETVILKGSGPDAVPCLEALIILFDDKFGLGDI